jgi:hypothetical protein
LALGLDFGPLGFEPCELIRFQLEIFLRFGLCWKLLTSIREKPVGAGRVVSNFARGDDLEFQRSDVQSVAGG